MRDTSKKRQCTIYVPGMTVPIRCESSVFKAGRCTAHYTDWREARVARGIEQDQYRETAKPNKRGRITPPILARVTPEVKAYTKKAPKTRADFKRMVKAEAKRSRKRGPGRPAITVAA